MTVVQKNLLANFLGKGWSAAVALAFVPVYTRYLGIEAYGLVGIFSILSALVNLFDFGLSATINRELARRTAQNAADPDTRDLVRTLEVIYWSIGAALAIVVLAASGVLAAHWVRAGSISIPTVRTSIALMAGVLALQWPLTFYGGGLLGLQRQALWNGLVAGGATLRAVGAVVVLARVSNTIVAFFVWQLVASAIQVAFVVAALWWKLPGGGRPRVRRELLAPIWRFAAGMSGISILALVLTQIDKIVLSRILPLKDFGYYALASVVSLGLYTLILPVFDAFFPRFSTLVALRDEDALRRVYHRACQLMSVLILPIAAVLAIWADRVLLLWTRDPSLVAQTRTLVPILVCGTALNGVMTLPFALQLAHGWTRLTLAANAIGVALMIPFLFAATRRFGSPGAASVWLVLNAGYVLFLPHLVHRRLLPGETSRWYLRDVGAPLAAAAVGACLPLLLVRGNPASSPAEDLFVVVVAWGLAAGGAFLAVPELRSMLRGRRAVAGGTTA
jgi:O-antigen/teichoic acid export membrane protein